MQLVEPGYTEAISSSTLIDYQASRAVDGDVRQIFPFCSHTDTRLEITEAWLRIDLKKIFNMATVKLWYRNDSKYPV